MNDTAQETTVAMATLVEHEVLGVPLLPVEGEQKKEILPSHIAALLLITVHYQYCIMTAAVDKLFSGTGRKTD